MQLVDGHLPQLLAILAACLVAVLIWADIRTRWLPGWAATGLAILGVLDGALDDEIWERAMSAGGMASLLALAVAADYAKAWIRRRHSGSRYHRLALPPGDIALLLAISTWFAPAWLMISLVMGGLVGLAISLGARKGRLPLGPVFLGPAVSMKLLLMAVMI